MFDWLKTIGSSRRNMPGAAVGTEPTGGPSPRAGPGGADAEHKRRGDKYFNEGEMAHAEVCYRQALAINPAFAEALNALGNALGLQGKHVEATACYQNAIALKPDYASAFNNLGNLLHSRGRLDEAISCYRQALALKPDFAAEVHNNLGGVLHQQGNLADAVTCYQMSIALKPGYAGAHTNLGIALSYLGKVDEALECYRVALSLDPGDVDAHSNLLFIMHYFDGITPSAIFAEHQRFARRFEAPLQSRWLPHANARDPEKRLKIGYVSPDFRNHSVAYFIEPILERHDKSRLEVFCYYNHADSDGVTDRIRRAADHWTSCVGWSDQALAEKIRSDGIDVLVDLAGHTSHGRILTFARKPAPVQVAYLGYQDTTGLAAIDYRFTDAFADPADLTGQFHVERLWHLPQTSWCYRPQENSPDVIGHPPLKDCGYVTFGCLNNFAKVTDPVLAAWAKVLDRVASSRLLLKVKGIEKAGDRAEIESRLADLGIPAGRLDLVGHQKTHPYALYNRIDVALDPFPYNGCTTSFDTLWMGVPFVALAGRTSASRVGVSILTNAGLPELIAESQDDYVRIAASLALDPGRLAEARAGLRERVRQGVLMDAQRMAVSMEDAYREMWRAWCSART